MVDPRRCVEPSELHPALWRVPSGRWVAACSAAVLPSGFARLDAELPGGGWPQRVLTELLFARYGVGEMRLLAPCLAQVAQAGRAVMLFDPPAQLSADALAQLGVTPGQCIVVRGRPGALGLGGRRQRGGGVSADLCWALEQALRSGQVGALLAWPGAAARPDVLRRLQLAAQAHEGPAFLLREAEARSLPSPAPLRLLLGCAGPDGVEVQIFKRRGPALAAPLRLALPAVLSPRALARAQAPWPAPRQAASAVAPVSREPLRSSQAWRSQLTGQAAG